MIFLISLYLFSNSGNRKLENWSLLPNGPTTSLSKIKKSVSSLYGSESSASTLYLDEVHKELTKSKNNYLLEDETDGIRRMEKYNSPNERSNIHLNAAGKNNFKRDPVVLQNIVQNETLNKKIGRATNGPHRPFREQQKDESIIASRKVFTAIHLLDILLTLIFYLDNRRHKNDIQDKKNIFVESKSSKERRRVGTGDSEKSFLAAQQKTSLEHYKDYLFASHHHNYDQKHGFDFFSTTTHNNAFHHPYLVLHEKIKENEEKGFKNGFFKDENNGKISENDRKKDAKLGSETYSPSALSNSFNHNKTKILPFDTIDVRSLNKNHSIQDNDEINDIKPSSAITNPSKKLTKSKSNTITRLDNPSHNISSSIEEKKLLLERKMDLSVNKTLNISDSFIPQDTKVFHSRAESEKYLSNVAEIPDNSSNGLKDKFNHTVSLDDRIGSALDFKRDAISILNTANYISSSNYSKKDPYHTTTFNQINENLFQPNIIGGKNISFVPSNITLSSSMEAVSSIVAAITLAQQLFNNSSLNSKTEISSAEAEKLTRTPSLQPPIFHPKNFSYSPSLNVKMEHSVVIPSPRLAVSQPTYHKNNDTLYNGKDQEQWETNDSHYHKILAKKSEGAGGGNFSSGSLASNMRVKYSPFLTPSLPQIIHTIRKLLGHNLTGNNGSNFKNEETGRLTEGNVVKGKKNKRNSFSKNISEDGFAKNHKSSERAVRKNMSDDFGYQLYDEHERKTKSGFEGSGLWPENNRSGGIIITMLEKVVEEIALEEGK